MSRRRPMKPLTAYVGVLLVALAFVLLYATACGSSGPDAACKAAMQQQYNAAVTSPAAQQAGKPAACNGVPDAQLRQIVGQVIAGAISSPSAAPASTSPAQRMATLKALVVKLGKPAVYDANDSGVDINDAVFVEAEWPAGGNPASSGSSATFYTGTPDHQTRDYYTLNGTGYALVQGQGWYATMLAVGGDAEYWGGITPQVLAARLDGRLVTS